ncbi:MAG: GlmU family protein [Bacteroidota bacterium]
MLLLLVDPREVRTNLLPLTYTRPVAGIRVGIDTIAEKWQRWLPGDHGYITQSYLEERYPFSLADDVLLVHGGVCPTQGLISTIEKLQPGQSLVQGDTVLVTRAGAAEAEATRASGELPRMQAIEFAEELTVISQVWHIFQKNGAQIRADFEAITRDRHSAGLDCPYTTLLGKENIFVEEGAKVTAAILNAEKGPIYLGKDSEIQEGAIIRGPLALGEGAVVNMGAKLRGDNTVGPWCKVGGEVSNSVLFAYSSKGHDGFIGNTVIGEWCNLGADTNTSNLKNNYAPVKLWNYQKGGFVNSNQQFCGLIMGDHSKTGINTMLNTGTVVGVSANIFGPGFPRNFVPSFAWGGSQGFTTFQLRKAFEVADRVMPRRNRELDEVEKGILQTVFDTSAEYRIWEKK